MMQNRAPTQGQPSPATSRNLRKRTHPVDQKQSPICHKKEKPEEIQSYESMCQMEVIRTAQCHDVNNNRKCEETVAGVSETFPVDTSSVDGDDVDLDGSEVSTNEASFMTRSTAGSSQYSSPALSLKQCKREPELDMSVNSVEEGRSSSLVNYQDKYREFIMDDQESSTSNMESVGRSGNSESMSVDTDSREDQSDAGNNMATNTRPFKFDNIIKDTEVNCSLDYEDSEAEENNGCHGRNRDTNNNNSHYIRPALVTLTHETHTSSIQDASMPQSHLHASIPHAHQSELDARYMPHSEVHTYDQMSDVSSPREDNEVDQNETITEDKPTYTDNPNTTMVDECNTPTNNGRALTIFQEQLTYLEQNCAQAQDTRSEAELDTNKVMPDVPKDSAHNGEAVTAENAAFVGELKEEGEDEFTGQEVMKGINQVGIHSNTENSAFAPIISANDKELLIRNNEKLVNLFKGHDSKVAERLTSFEGIFKNLSQNQGNLATVAENKDNVAVELRQEISQQNVFRPWSGADAEYNKEYLEQNVERCNSSSNQQRGAQQNVIEETVIHQNAVGDNFNRERPDQQAFVREKADQQTFVSERADQQTFVREKADYQDLVAVRGTQHVSDSVVAEQLASELVHNYGGPNSHIIQDMLKPGNSHQVEQFMYGGFERVQPTLEHVENRQYDNYQSQNTHVVHDVDLLNTPQQIFVPDEDEYPPENHYLQPLVSADTLQTPQPRLGNPQASSTPARDGRTMPKPVQQGLEGSYTYNDVQLHGGKWSTQKHPSFHTPSRTAPNPEYYDQSENPCPKMEHRIAYQGQDVGKHPGSQFRRETAQLGTRYIQERIKEPFQQFNLESHRSVASHHQNQNPRPAQYVRADEIPNDIQRFNSAGQPLHHPYQLSTEIQARGEKMILKPFHDNTQMTFTPRDMLETHLSQNYQYSKPNHHTHQSQSHISDVDYSSIYPSREFIDKAIGNKIPPHKAFLPQQMQTRSMYDENPPPKKRHKSSRFYSESTNPPPMPLFDDMLFPKEEAISAKQKYFVVNPSETTKMPTKTLMSKYIDFLILENEQITEISKSVNPPVDIYVTEDMYFMDSLKYQFPFPSKKFVEWVESFYPKLNFHSMKFKGRLPIRQAEGTSRVCDPRPTQQILEDTFYFFQREAMNVEG